MTQEQCEIVGRVQEALKQYPNVVRGLVAEYGFELTDNRYLEWENSEEGIKHWDDTDLYKPPETVNYNYCVSYFASNDPTRITNIEIFKNIHVTPSLDSIDWDENQILFERLVPEGDIEISIDVDTRKRQQIMDEQRAKNLTDRKAKLANEFDTKARENPQGYTREWEITQNWI